MAGEYGAARANDLIPNAETQLAVTTMNDGTPLGTLSLTGVTTPTIAVLYADKPFCVARDAAPDPTKSIIFPATTVVYYPVNGLTQLFAAQANGGDTVNLRCTVWGKRTNET